MGCFHRFKGKLGRKSSKWRLLPNPRSPQVTPPPIVVPSGGVYIDNVQTGYSTQDIYNLMRPFGTITRIVAFPLLIGFWSYLIFYSREDEARGAVENISNPPPLSNMFSFYFVPAVILRTWSSVLSGANGFLIDTVRIVKDQDMELSESALVPASSLPGGVYIDKVWDAHFTPAIYNMLRPYGVITRIITFPAGTYFRSILAFFADELDAWTAAQSIPNPMPLMYVSGLYFVPSFKLQLCAAVIAEYSGMPLEDKFYDH